MARAEPPVIVARAAVADASAPRRRALESACELTMVAAPDLKDPALTGALAAAQGLLVTGVTVVDRELLDLAPQLRVVSVRAVGYDRVDVDACQERGAVVCYTPGVLDGAVADLTVSLMLAVARRLPANVEAVRGGAWHRDGTRPALGRDLRGKTLGLLGMGRIGQVVARTAALGFGMTVLYHNRTRLDPAVEEDVRATYVGRPRLFEEADFLSVHTPLTPETRHGVSVAEFRSMKKTAVLLNTSRGAVVDEPALVDALRSGEIGGAGLDVMSVEPYPPTGPLASLPNVVLTPHIGSATQETRQAMSDLAIDNLLEGLAGGSPPAVVPDQRAGAAAPASP